MQTEVWEKKGLSQKPQPPLSSESPRLGMTHPCG